MSVCFFLSFYFMGNFFNFFPILGIFLKFSLFFFSNFFPDFLFLCFFLAIFCQFCRSIRAPPRLSLLRILVRLRWSRETQPGILRLNLEFWGKKGFLAWIRVTLAECEWRAAASGLKPLRLPRAPLVAGACAPLCALTTVRQVCGA